MIKFYKISLFLIIFIMGIGFIRSYNERIDLSDRNPIVYCLKHYKKFTFDQVKDYLLKYQDPEYALEDDVKDDLFALCVEHVAKDGV